MNKRDLRRAEMAADLLCPPPEEIVHAMRLRDVVDYLWQERGLRTPEEIVTAIRRFKRGSPAIRAAIKRGDVERRVERMVDHELEMEP